MVAKTKEASMSDVVFLRGAKTILRPPDKEFDPKLFRIWINDPEVRIFLTRVLPADLDTEERWIDSLSSNKSHIVLVIETLEGRPIGTIGLHGIDWINRVAVSGAMIGEKKYWGKGYGTDAKMLLLHYAFCSLGLRKICSSVLSLNPRSMAYQIKHGSIQEGVRKKQILKDGRYYDEILLAVWKNNFMKIWRNYKKVHNL
jgi:diamine N-acetyltransferase